MYGCVFRLRPLPGHEEAMLEELRRWGRELRPQAAGFIAEYIYRLEARSGEYINTVVFESREAYQRNGANPKQDRWYRRLRAHLVADPEWEDGEVVIAVN